MMQKEVFNTYFKMYIPLIVVTYFNTKFTCFSNLIKYLPLENPLFSILLNLLY